MYTKPGIYKAYSIVVAVFSVLLFLGSVITAIIIPTNTFDSIEYVKDLLITLKVTVILCALFSLFFVYMNVSSIYTFAEMIKHEQSGAKTPYVKNSFTMPAKAYRTFGSVIFYISAVLELISIAIVVISYSISHSAFLAIPIIPVASSLISLLLVYVTYYSRYKAFADLLEVNSSDEPSSLIIEQLGENKPSVLRGYCVFLFAIVILLIIGTIVSLFFISGLLFKIFDSGSAIALIICYIDTMVLLVLSLCVTGCYYDNLAKMLEHNMIKYKLI